MNFPDSMESAMGHASVLAPDQLRALIAHCAALHTQAAGPAVTVETLQRIATRIEALGHAERMATIALKVAQKHGVSERDLHSRSRRRYIAHARQEAMYLMRLVRRADGLHRYSLPQIAAFFGVDHSTVVHGVAAHARRAVAFEAAA